MSMELITQLRLLFKGKFDKVENDHFSIRFRSEVLSKKTMEDILDVNGRSLSFLFSFFNDHNEQISWEKMLLVYYAWYDSKLFYTHHWGTGKAADAAVLSVFLGGGSDYRIAVHENTHIITMSNWTKNSSSFLAFSVRHTSIGRIADNSRFVDEVSGQPDVERYRYRGAFPFFCADVLDYELVSVQFTHTEFRVDIIFLDKFFQRSIGTVAHFVLFLHG